MYLNHDPYEYFVVDIETDSLDATVIHCAVIQNAYTGEVFEFRPDDIKTGKLADFINTNNKKPTTKWVGHNAISFDFPVINALCGTDVLIDNIVDTLTLSYLYHPHMPKGHSLRAWGERFNFPKIEFNDFSEFSEDMLTYCKQDVALTVKIFKALSNKMLDQEFSELSCEIEHKIRKIIDDQQNNGVFFDERQATLLLADFQSRKADLEKRIHTAFPPELVVKGTYKYKLRQDGTPYASYKRHLEKYPRLTFNASKSMYRVWDYEHFNIGSPKQRVDRLLRLGWKPTEFTPRTPKGGGGNPKVTEDQLISFAEQSGIPEVELIKDWMLYDTRISSLEEWLKHLKEDGRIHGRVFTCGAGTRRMRHNTPNTANICGIDKPYGLEMRSLWCVPDNKRLVGIDAKGLEGRVLVHYLNNPEAEEYLTSDFHTENAIAVYRALGFKDIARELEEWRDAGKPKSDIAKYRQLLKTLFYAFLYGAANGKLGSILGLNHRKGRAAREALMSVVPGLKDLVEKVQREFNSTSFGWIKTIDGGFVRCPSPHAALNYLCQSAGGIIMKLATILSYGYSIESLGGAKLDTPLDLDKAMKVLDVHDETQWEVEPDYAETCGQIYCKAIELAGELLNFNIKMEGDYSVGQNWAETH